MMDSRCSGKRDTDEKGLFMKIILVGGGKVGTALARQLSEEGHNVTVVDTNKARVEHLTESCDVLGIVGNGSSITTLAEAGIEDADVFIAVTTKILMSNISRRVGFWKIRMPSTMITLVGRISRVSSVRLCST